ncbi:hypothetical protein ACJX0J_036472, partial [Zea mays]
MLGLKNINVWKQQDLIIKILVIHFYLTLKGERYLLSWSFICCHISIVVNPFSSIKRISWVFHKNSEMVEELFGYSGGNGNNFKEKELPCADPHMFSNIFHKENYLDW